jgi:hypothetical protein
MILGEGRRNTGMDRDGWRDSFAKVKPQEWKRHKEEEEEEVVVTTHTKCLIVSENEDATQASWKL